MAPPAASSYGSRMNSAPIELPPRSVTILGATGSVGTSTVDLLRRDRDRYPVVALSANKSADALAKLARDLGARFAAVADPSAYRVLKDGLGATGIEAAAGEEAVIEAARQPADWVMAAVSGATGLRATMAAVERGATVALANKECLVCAGALFMRRASETNATVLPVDSEHNAVFQAMTAGRRGEVRRIILTASGGPFRTWSMEAIRTATVDQALQHPNWQMGPKITIDSATLMNKGLEIIEAHHLFALAPNEIDVLVHPQSIVHAMVEFRDGSLIAQLGPPDMRIPISHCLGWPARIESPATRLDLERIATLSFEPPDLARFPALALARRAMEAGNGATTVLNAANEVAVAEFMAGRLSFGGIAVLVATAMEAASGRGIMREPASVEDAVSVDHSTRLLTLGLLPEIAAKAS
jgi:1-deoxy-D-xylulose-5-phosphate reductoisomerase